MKAESRIQIVGRIPQDLRQAMTRAAKTQGVTLNQVIIDALRKHLVVSARRAPGPTEFKGATR